MEDHETRIRLLEDNDKVQDKRLDEHGNQIDDLRENDIRVMGDLKLIMKDVENTNRTTQKIEDKLDRLSDNRQNDHYATPLKQYRKIIESIVIAVVGAVLLIVFQKIGLK